MLHVLLSLAAQSSKKNCMTVLDRFVNHLIHDTNGKSKKEKGEKRIET